MIGNELAGSSLGWHRWLYRFVGTLDVDEWIWFWHYRKFFFPYLQQLQTADVLDAGCGNGLWSFYLARNFSTFHIAGIDTRDSAVKFCKEVGTLNSYTNVSFMQVKFADMSFRKEFDVILSFFSLHYSYRQDLEILKKMACALKPGGVLMLSVPIARSLVPWKKADKETSRNSQLKYGIQVDTHEFLEHYHPDDLISKLNAAGFELVILKQIVGRMGGYSKQLYRRASGHGFLKLLSWVLTFPLAWIDSQIPVNRGEFLLVLARIKE